ncbi:hypothetical protein ACLOJK_027657 [Asimina triloba]
MSIARFWPGSKFLFFSSFCRQRPKSHTDSLVSLPDFPRDHGCSFTATAAGAFVVAVVEMGWRYKAGLMLILAVVIIWVTSAEVTQIKEIKFEKSFVYNMQCIITEASIRLKGIYANYKQPFAITYLGASLMVVYLPIAFIKDWVWSSMRKQSSKSGRKPEMFVMSSSELESAINLNGMQMVLEVEMQGSMNRKDSDTDLPSVEEGKPLIARNKGDLDTVSKELTTKEIAKYGFYIAPIWFITEVRLSWSGDDAYMLRTWTQETLNLRTMQSLFHIWLFSKVFYKMLYLSNAALARTSVASTTVLSSTSGLFTLFIGALLGQDTLNIAKVIAVFVSLAGVAMTTLGKTWANDELQLNSDGYFSLHDLR